MGYMCQTTMPPWREACWLGPKAPAAKVPALAVSAHAEMREKPAAAMPFAELTSGKQLGPGGNLIGYADDVNAAGFPEHQ